MASNSDASPLDQAEQVSGPHRGTRGGPSTLNGDQDRPASLTLSRNETETSASSKQEVAEQNATNDTEAGGTEHGASIEAAAARLTLHDCDEVHGAGSADEETDGGPDERDREPQPKFGLKVLIPGITAGCLIGKGGRIITQLQTDTSTRVKLSQKNEFFPGTHDRVALVQGDSPAMVAEAVAEMLRRLREAGRQHPQAPSQAAMSPWLGQQTCDGDAVGGRPAEITAKLLIPLAAGGLIIGKKGENVRAIKARTGAEVRLDDRDKDVAGVPSERMCSIQGDMEGVIKVVLMIVSKMAEDRGLSKYQSNQTCYQSPLPPNAPSGVMDPTMTGSLGSSSPPMGLAMPWGRPSPDQQLPGRNTIGTAGAVWGGNVDPDSGASTPTTGQPQAMSSNPTALNTGASAPASNVVRGIAGGIARAGMGGGFTNTGATGISMNMGMGVGLMPTGSLASNQGAQGMMPGNMMYGYSYPGAPMGVHPMYMYGTEMPLGATATPAPNIPSPEIMVDHEYMTQIQVAMPDHMIGVILGKGGSNVVDMQNATGARIQVSQRGEYIPGTTNRPVTISGTAQAVANAQLVLHNLGKQAMQHDYRQDQSGVFQAQPTAVQQQAQQQSQQQPPFS